MACLIRHSAVLFDCVGLRAVVAGSRVNGRAYTPYPSEVGGARVPQDLNAGQQFHITWRAAQVHGSYDWVLSAALYFDQFSARVLSAACSSARHDSMVRPTAMAYPAAALQLGRTSSFGGPSACAMVVSSPNVRATTAIFLAGADIVQGPCWL